MPVKSGWREPRAYPQEGGKEEAKKKKRRGLPASRSRRKPGEPSPGTQQQKGTKERRPRQEGEKERKGKKGREKRRDEQEKQTHTHAPRERKKREKKKRENKKRKTKKRGSGGNRRQGITTHKAEQRKGRASSNRPAKVETMGRQKKSQNVTEVGQDHAKGTNR